MNRKAINFYSLEDKPKGVETFFYEGNSSPILIEAKGEDTSIDFLNNYLYENAIDQTGSIPKERLKNSFEWARNNLTIAGVIKWGFLLMIIFAIVGGYLGIL